MVNWSDAALIGPAHLHLLVWDTIKCCEGCRYWLNNLNMDFNQASFTLSNECNEWSNENCLFFCNFILPLFFYCIIFYRFFSPTFYSYNWQHCIHCGLFHVSVCVVLIYVSHSGLHVFEISGVLKTKTDLRRMNWISSSSTFTGNRQV